MRFQLLHKKPPPLKLRGWVLFFFLVLAAGASAQNVTLNVHAASLESVFSEVKRQTGYSFVYSSERIKGANPVSITVSNSALAKVLELLFRDQPFSY
jgi:type II secretory pathway component GspD/PulD (secretin)